VAIQKAIDRFAGLGGGIVPESALLGSTNVADSERKSAPGRHFLHAGHVANLAIESGGVI